MKIVFSYWGYKETLTKSFISMAKISNFFAQKHGFDTILFCQQNDIKLFKEINYNEIKVLPDELMNKFPKDLWSMSKIVAMTLMDEPYIIIDFDLFLFKTLNTNKIIDITFFHTEPWALSCAKLENEWFRNIKTPEIKKNEDLLPYNCAIIGVKNFTVMKKCAKKIINNLLSVDKNKLNYLLNVKNFKKWKDPNIVIDFFLPTWLFEQVWLPQLIKNEKISINVFYENPYTVLMETILNGHYHLWGSKDDRTLMTVVRDFTKILEEKNVDYKDINFKFNFIEEKKKLILKDRNALC